MPFDDDLPPPRSIKEENKNIAPLRQQLIQLKRQRKVKQMQHILAHRIAGNRDPYPEPAMKAKIAATKEMDAALRGAAKPKPAPPPPKPLPEPVTAKPQSAKSPLVQQDTARPADKLDAEKGKKPPLQEDPRERLRRLLEEAQAKKTDTVKTDTGDAKDAPEAVASLEKPEDSAETLRALLQKQREKGASAPAAEDAPKPVDSAERLRQMLAERRKATQASSEPPAPEAPSPLKQPPATAAPNPPAAKTVDSPPVKPAVAPPPPTLVKPAATSSSAALPQSNPPPVSEKRPALGQETPAPVASRTREPLLPSQAPDAAVAPREHKPHPMYVEPTRKQKAHTALKTLQQKVMAVAVWHGIMLGVGLIVCRLLLQFNPLSQQHWQDFAAFYESGAAIAPKFPITWLALVLVYGIGVVRVWKKPARIGKWWKK